MPRPEDRLLAGVPSHRRRRRAYRLASLPLDVLGTFELGAEGKREMRELLSAAGYRPASSEEFIEAPFRPKRRFRRATRFSNGSFPVFYTSLEPATAEAEVRHWLGSIAGSPASPRTAYYEQISCTFDGIEKDVRPKQREWPGLVHEDDYAFCNRLGAEAVGSGLDALVTPCARRAGGVNLPIFRKGAVQAPQVHGPVAVTWDPGKSERGSPS